MLKEFVPDTANISLRSFRAGGSTSAANAQVPDRFWRCRGLWRAESAKDHCVERLLVSN